MGQKIPKGIRMPLKAMNEVCGYAPSRTWGIPHISSSDGSDIVLVWNKDESDPYRDAERAC